MRLDSLVDRLLVNWLGAACDGLDVAMFFPEQGQQALATDAKKVCATCRIKQACLDYAMTFPHRELPGIWGGTSEGERLKLRRSMTSSHPSGTVRLSHAHPRNLT